MGGRCRERNIPVPCKRVRGYFVLGVGCFSKDYFSCGSCTISSARRSGLTGAPKVKRRLNCTTNQSSEERIVIVTLFRTLAFNGLLSVFCGGLPDSIGNGWFGIKVLGAAARNLSVCSDRKDGAAESMLQTTSSYGTTCGSVVNQPFFPWPDTKIAGLKRSDKTFGTFIYNSRII